VSFHEIRPKKYASDQPLLRKIQQSCRIIRRDQPAIFSGHIDGLVKSPSAALRFNSFSAVPEGLASQGPPSSVFARLAFGAFLETIFLPTFYEFFNITF
jgi:hypothetical protein